ncbi:MAG: hypothetical protein EP335_00825 [Alphaproteobacteria bacterium]|nr:MAG: hypothetical protein EP335_00825 [Alphaproteobacteria bacterium]
MNRKRSLMLSVAAITAFAPMSAMAWADPAPAVRAGAAKLDITPATPDLPAPLSKVADPIHVRAVAIESEGKLVVILSLEVPAVAPDIWNQLRHDIAEAAGIPASQLVLSTTHTHNSLRVAAPGPSPIPVSAAFTENVRQRSIAATKEAIARLKPAEIGYSTALLPLVKGRNEWRASENRYVDGADRTGREPVDQTFGVLSLRGLDGQVIGLVLNYGIEPVVYELAHDQVSGDVPGKASSYLEDTLADQGTVALFTIGAPASAAYRIWKDDVGARGPAAAGAIKDAMGTLIAEDALAQLGTMQYSGAAFKMATATTTLSCPGKKTTPRNLRSHCSMDGTKGLPRCEYHDEPFPAVSLDLSMLRLGDKAAYLVADSNVVPALWLKIKDQLPLRNTQMISSNFGPFRFVVNEAAYALNTYPATDTRAQAGCAENGFTKKVEELVAATR